MYAEVLLISVLVYLLPETLARPPPPYLQRLYAYTDAYFYIKDKFLDRFFDKELHFHDHDHHIHHGHHIHHFSSHHDENHHKHHDKNNKHDALPNHHKHLDVPLHHHEKNKPKIYDDHHIQDVVPSNNFKSHTEKYNPYAFVMNNPNSMKDSTTTRKDSHDFNVINIQQTHSSTESANSKTTTKYSTAAVTEKNAIDTTYENQKHEDKSKTATSFVGYQVLETGNNA